MKKRFIALLCFVLVAITFSSMFVTVLAAESTGVKGDLNYDGVLNRKDYSLLSVYLKNGSGNYQISEVDFNGDGSVNDSDKIAMNEAIISNFDNNSSGSIDAVDYNLLEMYLANYDSSKLANFNVAKCDYNGDGVITFADLNLLGYYEVFDQYSPRY